ncbi:MAG: hypothetical protein Q9163_006482, partial [Psora crenata]
MEVLPAPAEKPTSPATGPKKRRRRAPATGAADDCFACQERGATCDRRRPYCSTCLEQGHNCSGYKTVLTWGMGVASRGKLRGLSLPIASARKAAPAGTDPPGEPPSTTSPRKLTKLSPQCPASDARAPDQLRTPTRAATTMTRSSPTTPTNYGFVYVNPTSALSSVPAPMDPPPSGLDWRQPTSLLPRAHDDRSAGKKPRKKSPQPLRLPSMHPARDYGAMPMTASIVGGYGGHHGFGLSAPISPMEPTFTGYGLVPGTSKVFPHPSHDSYGTNFFTSSNLGWTGGSQMASSASSSDQSSQTGTDDMPFFGGGGMDRLPPLQQPFPPAKGLAVTSAPDATAFMMESKFPGVTRERRPSLVPDEVGDPSMNVLRTLPSLAIGNNSKLRFLIDYYDQVISPVIVAFDGPTNPYRAHILRLAIESETLQHAIAALSASNLRMRRSQKPTSVNRSLQSDAHSSHDDSVRRSSLAYRLMDGGMDRLPQTSTSEPSAEELYHKGVAIRGLNEQLTDPHRRQDDSILASLLILCLYHICDTGVAKFKTQFAGVKKILALRGGTTGSNSKATNWLTIMFTWFDAMTATINDREGQLSGDDIDLSKPRRADEWALENLAGCDGRLFKTIAKLGRLNMLSQNKPVANNGSPTAKTPTLPSLSCLDYYSMNHNRFDGNGWSTLPETAAAAEMPAETDTRARFWQEWTEIRQCLYEWQLDDTVQTPTESANAQGDRRDLLHISESFRYSALLYTERLAYPHLPSVHANFQALVTQALYHIANVQSDVFLLWPLFITGTECVSEQGRFLIRERCLDIQKDSGFFNNISGLELLEKIWRDDCGDEATEGGGGMQPMN